MPQDRLRCQSRPKLVSDYHLGEVPGYNMLKEGGLVPRVQLGDPVFPFPPRLKRSESAFESIG